MKKSIGLTANISEFRPNLPQTKHLNYFMGTNPVYMAGGEMSRRAYRITQMSMSQGDFSLRHWDLIMVEKRIAV